MDGRLGLDPAAEKMEKTTMKRTFDIFAYPKGNTEQQKITEHNFVSFISTLSATGGKFTATLWSSEKKLALLSGILGGDPRSPALSAGERF